MVNVLPGVPDPDHGGDPWWDRLTGASDSVARMRDRRAEDREALALAGRTALDLDLLEGQYRDEPVALEPLVERLGALVPPTPPFWLPRRSTDTAATGCSGQPRSCSASAGSR